MNGRHPIVNVIPAADTTASAANIHPRVFPSPFILVPAATSWPTAYGKTSVPFDYFRIFALSKDFRFGLPTAQKDIADCPRMQGAAPLRLACRTWRLWNNGKSQDGRLPTERSARRTDKKRHFFLAVDRPASDVSFSDNESRRAASFKRRARKVARSRCRFRIGDNAGVLIS